jgi:saccharopine dehydrogenase (NAD+, L-lysine-forming)
MSKLFWLRAETKEFEYRRGLSPDSVNKLIDAGHEVIVEDSEDSIIKASDYENVGAKIVAANSWIKDAPADAIIVGLKALPGDLPEYKHTHIYFAHVYKEQDGWQEVLTKFKKGNGKIIDLEYMVDENSRRVCAFGYWAGYVGASLAVLFSNDEKQKAAISALQEKRSFIDKDALIRFVKDYSNPSGNGIVLGCLGRSGKGATDFFKDVSWSVIGWDKIDTQGGGPFPQILNYDVFVNCVLSTAKIPPFLTHDILQENHKLKVISDVTCDPDSDCNVLPLYDKATDLDDPILTIKSASGDVSLVAIDNLPSILPKESTFDFSDQLEEFLIHYDENTGPLKRSLDVFHESLKKL